MRQTMIGFLCGVAVCLAAWAFMQHQAFAGEGDDLRRGETPPAVAIGGGAGAGGFCPGDLNGDGVVDVSDLLVLLSNWGQCDLNTCVGHCGEQAPGGCYCDEFCVENDDCCDDACDECEHCPPDLNSCAGNCGEQAPGGCYCDEFCVENDDCCDDACDECEHCGPG